MMAFIESPRFPDDISYGVVGGPGYSTEIVALNSGHESRNQNWSVPLASYDVSHGVKNSAQMAALIAFFRSCKGRAHGFRFKDWMDYKVLATEGLMGDGAGTGLPAAYQLVKRYASGSLIEARAIRKPVSGTLTLYKNGTPVTLGSSAGQATIDHATGTVTFVASATATASAITVGATTQIVFPNNLGLAAGKKLYLSGFTGADAALLNDLAHTINSLSGSGPYTFTLATNTAGKTITVGSGKGWAYPQASDALTWAGEFDVPCRFDTDQMKASIEHYNLYAWGNIPVVEIRA